MTILFIAVTIYALLSIVVALFQFGLAVGMPWGELAMGGRYPGTFPTALRFNALAQAALLLLFAEVMLAQAEWSITGLIPDDSWTIWVVVAFSTISAILNTITPSKKERILWAPVAATMALCAWYVALFG